MASLLVREVPVSVVNRLKARAAARGRSLQAELKAILVEGSAADYSAVRRAAARMRTQLAGGGHSDSATLLARERRR